MTISRLVDQLGSTMLEIDALASDQAKLITQLQADKKGLEACIEKLESYRRAEDEFRRHAGRLYDDYLCRGDWGFSNEEGIRKLYQPNVAGHREMVHDMLTSLQKVRNELSSARNMVGKARSALGLVK